MSTRRSHSSTRQRPSRPAARRATPPQAASHRSIIQALGPHPDKLLHLGNKLWEAELTQDAALYFERAQQLAPKQAAVQEALALLALEKNDLDQAVDHLDLALQQRRDDHAKEQPAPPLSLLIKVFDKLLTQNQLGLATEIRQLFADIQPESPSGHQLQIKLDIKANKFDQALDAANQAVEAAPNDANTYAARLQLALQQQRYDLAVQDAETLIRLRNEGKSWNALLSLAFYHGKHYEQALDYALAAHTHQPSADTHHQLGRIYTSLKQYEQARRFMLKALELNPTQWHYHVNLGNIHMAEQDFHLAENAFNKAMALPGCDITPYINGMLNAEQQLDIEGVRRFRQQAEARFPGHPAPPWNASLSELRVGNFEAGWPLYEYRWQRTDAEAVRHFDCPRWTGKEALEGKTLLVHIEQGMGDFIQMCRYALLLVQQGARVILEVYGPLISLIKTLPTSLHLIERGLPLTEKEQPDFEIPIMSLPLAFNTRLETIPYAERYLGTLPERVEKWQAILGKKKRPRIGLAWSGSAIHPNDRNRSMTLEALAPLFDLPFDFHCLQHQVREADREAATFQNLQLHTRELRDFGDAAALADEMDLIISVDSAPAHLACALGKPTWILLPYVPDFRWLLDRADSPWYPSAVLFRQTEKREWDEVISTVVQLLADIAHPPAPTAH